MERQLYQFRCSGSLWTLFYASFGRQVVILGQVLAPNWILSVLPLLLSIPNGFLLSPNGFQDHVHTAISDKAVKSDDAKVEHYPWNQRILLVFPTGNLSAIASLEQLGTKVWFRSLSRSFIAYLTQEYGEGWRIKLRRYVCSLSEKQGSALDFSIGKRKRLPLDPSGHHKVGGLEPVGKQKSTIHWRTKNKYRQPHTHDNELLRDVQCGFRILRQVSVSSWWDWTGPVYSSGGGMEKSRFGDHAMASRFSLHRHYQPNKRRSHYGYHQRKEPWLQRSWKR